MSIPELDEYDGTSNEEEGQMSFQDIYEQLLLTEELILTIPAEAEETLRKGLASVKYKTNKKFQDQGMPVENSSLQFVVTPSAKFANAIQVHISLNKRAGVRVLDMSLPDDTL